MNMEEVRSKLDLREQYDNIIRDTRLMTKHISLQQRFQKARDHILDALQNRDPRNVGYMAGHTLYQVLYYLQSSGFWNWLTFILSWSFMYLVILDNESYAKKISLEAPLITFFLFDTFIDFYCKSFNKLNKNKKEWFYYMKAFLLLLMLIDLIIFISLPCYDSRPIRPFRILRAFIPVIFDQQLRKCMKALIAAYKIILVFLIFYTFWIVGYAYVASVTITYDPNHTDPNFPNQPNGFDLYASNYNQFKYMIYQIYALATYDNYPDTTVFSLQSYEPNQICWTVFIFLNMFLFATIPGTLIYNKFRQNRSKYILADQIKQQHSLILAFVTLAVDSNNLPMEVLIKFLFYFYREKVRFVNYITEICLKLDNNNNQTIQVNEFMQLNKIILYNSILYPPTFNDLSIWIAFQRYVSEDLHLKQIVSHWAFQLVVSIYIILCSINGMFLLYSNFHIVAIFDAVFIWLFFAELLLRITAHGIQVYFAQRWNTLDAFLICLNVMFFFITIGNNIDNIFKLNRILRVYVIFRLIFNSKAVIELKSELLEQIRTIFSTLTEIFPIISRFFLLFCFSFYIFGVLGMQIFYNEQSNTDHSPYDKFRQFSNYQTFINSQNVMMQTLTEGSWSTVTMDYCWKAPNFYAAIVILMMIEHIVIITIIGTLLKGVYWQLFFTIGGMAMEVQQQRLSIALKEREKQRKTNEINEISEQLNQKLKIEPNTVIRREIIEMMFDKEIIQKIKNFDFQGDNFQSVSDLSQRNQSRSKILENILQNFKISHEELQSSAHKKKRFTKASQFKDKRVSAELNFKDKQQEDYQQAIEELLNKLILSEKVKCAQIIAYPSIFVNFLYSKFKFPQEYITSNFDLNLNPLHNEESMKFHIYEMNSILGLQTSTRQKKEVIIDILSKNTHIHESLKDKIIKSKFLAKTFHIDSHGALKKMYLANTNDDLVNKLEIQYFSDVYGNSFKQINKITLEPLLKVSASLTSVLWNILSYPQMSNNDFFHFITHVQDQMSNKLLKVGSLVKFVYKINHESDIWFQVEKKRNQKIGVRFIKTGVWAYTPNMEDNMVYYARDIFNLEASMDEAELISNQEQLMESYIKLFYEGFQTLGLSLIDSKNFFQSNPKSHIYDLYVQNFELSSNQRRSSSTDLSVSNIMLVVLSKQEERRDIGLRELPYSLSDIQTFRKKPKKEDFILDDEDKETFEKLKNLSAMEHEKIIETEGLPFSYILNMMKQIQDIIKIYNGNFARQIEKALNSKYNETENISMQVNADQIELQNIIVEV